MALRSATLPRAGSPRSLVSWLAVLALFAAGCDHPENVPPARITIVSGNHQCGAPGDVLPEPIAVRVLGPRIRDFLGRKGSRPPAERVEVVFQVEWDGKVRPTEPEEAPRVTGAGPDAVPEDATTPPHPYPVLFEAEGAAPGPEAPDRVTVHTDTSGLARAWVRLGSQTGDWRIEAIIHPPDRKKPIKEHFRLVCGVVKPNEMLEETVGRKVPLRLQLVRLDNSGTLVPLAKRTVYFRLVGEPYGSGEGAEIDNVRDVTDAEGVRDGSDLVLGDLPGVYHVLAEVEPYEDDEPLRGILFRVVAVDWGQAALLLAAGVLLFLLGVRFLGNGFLLVLSPHVHLVTGPLAENRALGYVGGALAGATSQSSSTMASYLVSFANGGLLTARGGLGLLLGAAVGATALPQVLSLDLDFLVVPLLATGLLFLVLPRRAHLNSWGWVFLGLGLVFTSWEALQRSTDLAALSETFQREILPAAVPTDGSIQAAFVPFVTYLVIGVLAGTILRTSNLLVVLAILFASKGLTTVETGIPVVIGANVGSGLAILLRSCLKLREARRMAALYFLFNVFTAVPIIALSLIPVRGSPLYLWIVETVAPGYILHPVPENIAQHLAMAHTLFNLLGSVVFLVFPRWLLSVNDRVIPQRVAADDVKPYHLDEHLVAVPSLALREATYEIMYLTELCQKTVAEAFDAFRYGELQLADQVLRREEVISSLHRDIARYLVLVAESQLSRHDASTMEVLQTAAGNLGRVGEAGERLRDLATQRLDENISASQDADRDLGEVYDLVMAEFDNIRTLLAKHDARLEESAVKLVERLAKVRSRREAFWRKRLDESEVATEQSVALQMQVLIYQEAFDILFRVASHLAHIAQCMRILSPERL